MLITEMKAKETLASLTDGKKVFIINCEGCKEVHFPGKEALPPMKTQRAAVIGHPIGHTMSPLIQKRLFALGGIPLEYEVLELPDLEAGLPRLSERVHGVLMGEYKRLRQSEQNLLYFIQHLSSLTTAERELISCFMQGMKVKEIAAKRFVEPVTVKSQIRTLLSKTGCARTKDIVSMIHGLGLERLFM